VVGELTYEIFSLLQAKFLFGPDVGIVAVGPAPCTADKV
jgi:hypothetical protein